MSIELFLVKVGRIDCLVDVGVNAGTLAKGLPIFPRIRVKIVAITLPSRLKIYQVGFSRAENDGGCFISAG